MTGIPIQVFTVFGAGLTASLTPCVYPMLPIAVGYFGTQAQSGTRLKILFYFLGQTLAFIGLGIFAVWAGEAFGFTSESNLINIVIGIFLIGAGFLSFRGRLPRWMTLFSEKSQSWGHARSVVGSLSMGVGTAFISTPCTSPILSGVLVLMSQMDTWKWGVLLMSSYSIGFSLIFLAMGFGVLKLKRLPKSGRWLSWVHRISAVALILMGLYYIYRVIDTSSHEGLAKLNMETKQGGYDVQRFDFSNEFGGGIRRVCFTPQDRDGRGISS